MPTIGRQVCPTCRQTINEREIGLFRGMVEALWRVFLWCESRGRYTFTRKQMKHLLQGESQIARFGDWVMFGGLVYRPLVKDGRTKGFYGFNVERTKKFFGGSYAIPTVIYKNPLSKELRKENYCLIHEIPLLKTFLDENGEYIAVYKNFDEKSGQGRLV